MPAGRRHLRTRLPEPLPALLLLLVVCGSVASAPAGTADSINPLQYLDTPAAAAQLAPELAAALARQERELPPPATRPEQTAYVSQQPQQGNTTSLLSAFKDPKVTHVVLTGSYDVRGELDGQAIPINRNITITGLHGLEDVLDLRYKRAVLHLCSTCTLAFVNLTLAGERRGNGSPIDVLVGKPGSKVLVRSTARLRYACTTAKDTASVVAKTPRSKQVAPHGPKEQLVSAADVTFQGRKYPATMVVIDYSVDQPLTVQEGRVPTGGVAQYAVGMLRMCMREVPPDCLEIKSPDACVNMLIDSMLEEEKGAAAGAAGNKGVIIAAVLVPVVVLALIAALGALLFRKWRRRQQRQEQQEATKPPTDVEAAWSTTMYRHSEKEEASSSSLGDHQDWRLVSTVTAPSIQDGVAADTHIQLGELLGQGSFGRVYRGHWAGREVAVKIIPHTKSTVQDVDNEVSLMLSLQHPNLVRALQCMTYTHTCSTSATSTSCHPRSTSGGAMRRSLDVKLATKRASNTQASSGSSGQLPVSAGRQLQQQQQPAVSGSFAAEGRGGAAADVAGDTVSTSDSGCAPLVGQINPVETWLVMEFCSMGTLWSVFTSIFTNTGVQQQWSQDTVALSRLLLLQDAAQGLQALHSHNICHGDLNARNVLVSSDNVSHCGMVAKLADLGLSRMMKQHATHRTTETVGTLSHCAPELLTNGCLSPAGDVYAFGIMMWELYTGQAAFRRMHYAGFYEAIVLRQVRPVVPPDMPSDYAALLQWCWAADPKSRLRTDMLVEVLAFMVQQHQHRQADPTQPLQLHPQLKDRAPLAVVVASAAPAVAGQGGSSADVMLGSNQGPELNRMGTCTDSAASSSMQPDTKGGDEYVAV